MKKTLTPYYGGKAGPIGAKIASVVDSIPHRTYVEGCGGMAGVLMQKKPSLQEVYNDINDHLVNLFRVVRDAEQCSRLIESLKLTPYARNEWRFCRENFQTQADPVERARMVYAILSMGFVGSMGHKSFSFGGVKLESSSARIFFNGLSSIPKIAARITDVVIECQPVITICKRWDSAKTLTYLDPPYLHETRVTKSDYSHEMTQRDHMEMLEWAVQAKGHVLISGYNSPLYCQHLDRAGFLRLEMKTHSSVSYANGLGYNPKRVECLWINPRAQAAMRQGLFPSLVTSSPRLQPELERLT